MVVIVVTYNCTPFLPKVRHRVFGSPGEQGEPLICPHAPGSSDGWESLLPRSEVCQGGARRQGLRALRFRVRGLVEMRLLMCFRRVSGLRVLGVIQDLKHPKTQRHPNAPNNRSFRSRHSETNSTILSP